MSIPTKAYSAALYMRLSKEDGDKESASIGTQRAMLQAFSREHGFTVYGEYVDDGFSGTNFDRPAWRKMINDIEENRVNLVITKDLSRLGRDYITAGQVTELYFPQKGVRYIAINDGYDSLSPYTDIAPFKNIINEMYARDTSKKIRSAFQTKMHQGDFIGNFAPYGYQKDSRNKNHLIINPETAPVVQEIFSMAENGRPPSQIAESLNSRGVLTPGAYRLVSKDSKHLQSPGVWTSSTICKLLRNPVYLGHVVQGKTTKASFKSRRVVQKPASEWIVVENRHSPLVTQQTFDAVRERSVARRKSSSGSFQNIFAGIAFCADCGHRMSSSKARNGGSYRLVCGGYKRFGRRHCTSHAIDYDLLYRVVLSDLQALFSQASLPFEAFTMNRSRPAPAVDTAALLKREKQLDAIVKRLYEDNAAGRLSDARFSLLLGSFEEEQAMLSKKLSSTREPAEEQARQKGPTPPKLTPALLHQLIARIEIGQGDFAKGNQGASQCQHIKIYYRFADPAGEK